MNEVSGLLGTVFNCGTCLDFQCASKSPQSSNIGSRLLDVRKVLLETVFGKNWCLGLYIDHCLLSRQPRHCPSSSMCSFCWTLQVFPFGRGWIFPIETSILWQNHITSTFSDEKSGVTKVIKSPKRVYLLETDFTEILTERALGKFLTNCEICK